jgi:isoamylase
VYRAPGPTADTTVGDRFNPAKVLLDPYAVGVSKALSVRGGACGEGDNVATSMRATVIDVSDYDWAGDRPLNRPMHETVIYGCTSAASPGRRRRTWRTPARTVRSSRRSRI